MDEEKQNIYWLKGNYVQRNSIINRIKKSFGDFELLVYDNEYNFKYVEQKILESSCFGNNRLIILNDWPVVKKAGKFVRATDALKKILSKVPEDCILILNNLQTTSKLFTEEVKKVGKIREFEQNAQKYHYRLEGDQKLATLWVTDSLKTKDKVIDTDSASFLVDAISYNESTVNLDKLFLFLKKLCEYVGNRKKITDEDVFVVCSHLRNFVVWSLYDACDKQDIDRCFDLIENCIASARNVGEEIIGIVYSMLWRYKLLFMCKELSLKGVTDNNIWKKLSNIEKLERNGGSNFQIKLSVGVDMKTKVRKKMYSKAMVDSLFKKFRDKDSSVSCYNYNELLFINLALNRALPKIRSLDFVRAGFENAEIVIILKILCMVICGKIKNISQLSFLQME